MPVAEPIVATASLLLLHVPPEVKLESADVAPTQTKVAPSTPPGNALTVTTAVLAHPFVPVYNTTTVPAATPEIRPVAEPTVATEEFVLLHVPEGVVQFKDVIAPVHTLVVPVMELGIASTVTDLAAVQPPDTV